MKINKIENRFGKTLACKTLEKELLALNDKKIESKISKIICQATSLFKSLAILSEREYIINLVYDDLCQRININYNCPENIKSLTKNIIWSYAKRALKNKHKR